VTAGFTVLDLTPHPLQDDRLQVRFDTALLPTVRAGVQRLLTQSFRPPRQFQIRQLPRDFIADLGRQVFDVHKRAGCRQSFLLPLRKPRSKLNNFPPHSIIHDHSSRTFLK